MYIYYSIGNNSGPWTLVRIVEVSVIGGVRFRRFHCVRMLTILTSTIWSMFHNGCVIPLGCECSCMPGLYFRWCGVGCHGDVPTIHRLPY